MVTLRSPSGHRLSLCQLDNGGLQVTLEIENTNPAERLSTIFPRGSAELVAQDLGTASVEHRARREAFARSALSALVSAEVGRLADLGITVDPKKMSKLAFELADAMLAESAK